MLEQYYREGSDHERSEDFYLRKMDSLLGALGAEHRAWPMPRRWGCWLRTLKGIWRCWLASLRTPQRSPLRDLWQALKDSWQSLFGRSADPKVPPPGILQPQTDRAIWSVHRWLWGYAVKPAWLFGWMLGAVLVCAVVFKYSGVEKTEPRGAAPAVWRSITTRGGRDLGPAMAPKPYAHGDPSRFDHSPPW